MAAETGSRKLTGQGDELLGDALVGFKDSMTASGRPSTKPAESGRPGWPPRRSAGAAAPQETIIRRTDLSQWAYPQYIPANPGRN